jgi:hypothetical protein
VSPAAAVELRVDAVGGRLRFDLLIEIERGRLGSVQQEKLRRYDALVTGWCRLVERYKTLRTPPVVVFVCEDEDRAQELGRLADGAVTGQIAKAGTEESEWPCPGRRTIFFAAERAVHEGSLTAFQLPALPPLLRERLDGRNGKVCGLREVAIVEPGLLRVPRA